MSVLFFLQIFLYCFLVKINGCVILKEYHSPLLLWINFHSLAQMHFLHKRKDTLHSILSAKRQVFFISGNRKKKNTN